MARVDRVEVLGLQSNDPRAKSKVERRQGAIVGRRLAKGGRGRGAGPRGAVHGTMSALRHTHPYRPWLLVKRHWLEGQPITSACLAAGGAGYSVLDMALRRRPS